MISHDEHTHTHTQPTVAVVLSVSALPTVKETVVCVPVRDVPGLTASVELLASVRKSAVLAVASHATKLTARRQAVLAASLELCDCHLLNLLLLIA